MPGPDSRIVRLGQRIRSSLGRRSPALGDVDAERPCLPCEKAKRLRPLSLDARYTHLVGDDEVPRVSDNIADTVIGDHVLILASDNDRVYVLNSTAAMIWLSVDGVSSVAAIITDLAAEISVDESVIAIDVREMISRSLDAGILTIQIPEHVDETSNELDDNRLNTNEIPKIGPLMVSGTRLTIQTNTAETADLLRYVFGCLPTPDPGSQPQRGDAIPIPTTSGHRMSVINLGSDTQERFRIEVDDQLKWTGGTAGHLIRMATSLTNDIAVNGTEDHILFHAGAVERDGHVVLIAGDSGRGKSTLTAALTLRGFSYLTDEVAAVHPKTLEVVPYPKAIDLAHESLELLDLPEDLLPPEMDAVLKSTHKVPISPDLIGRVSTGGPLVLLVILDDPKQRENTDSTLPAEVLLTLELLGTVFRPSFSDSTILDDLVALGHRLSILRLPRLPLTEACAQIEAHLPLSTPVQTSSLPST